MKKGKKKISKSNQGLDLTTQQTCKNCGNVDTGRFCSACGQSFADYKRPMKQVFLDLFGMFSVDSSIFRTIGPFLFKPGFVAREYINGKRKKYMSPVRLYVFMSILYFFVASQVVTNAPGRFENFNLTSVNDSTKTAIVLDEDFFEGIKTDSAIMVVGEDTLFADTTSTTREEKLIASVLNAMENPALYISHFFKNVSYSLFVLMPVFALILQLLYIRRKRYYMEHLIFTLNVHSFTLLVMTIVALLQFLTKGNFNFTLFLLLVIPVYFLIGMKRFYEQKFWKILLKSLILGSLYIALLVASLAGLAYLTMIRM